MDDLVDRVAQLGAELTRHSPEIAAEAVRLYLGGLSVYRAARQARVPEARLREWIRRLDLKRGEAEVLEMKSAAAKVASTQYAARQREKAALRQQLDEPSIERC